MHELNKDQGYNPKKPEESQISTSTNPVNQVVERNKELQDLVGNGEKSSQILRILDKSPQSHLLKAAKPASTPSVMEDLKRWLFSPRAELSSQEKMLFDVDFKPSGRPLLFDPFNPSPKLRKKIWAKAQEIGKPINYSLKELLIRKAPVDDELKVVALQRYKNQPGERVKRLLERSYNFIDQSRKKLLSMQPITAQEEYDLIAQAGSALLRKADGMKLFTSSPGVLFVNHANDFENPDLLIAEELEQRGYNVRIFQIPSISRTLEQSASDLSQNEVVFFGDKNAAKVFQDATLAPERIVLHLLQRAPSLPSYSQSLNYTRILQWDKGEEEEGDQLFGNAWRNAQFTEDERKKIKALVLTREIDRYEDEISYGRLTHYLIEHREEDLKRARGNLGELEVEPIAEPGLRSIITRVVDRESG